MTSTSVAAPALAQTSRQPSVFQHVDSNGVDLTDGSFNFSFVEGSIGAGESTLTIARSYGRAGRAEGLPGRLRRSLFPANRRISLTFGSRAEHFDDDSNGNWIAQKRDGATLTGSGSSYLYTAADGTTVEYGAPGRSGVATYPEDSGIDYCTEDGEGKECALVPLAVRRPNGRRLELHWRVIETCGAPQFPAGQPCKWFPRLAAISNESAYLGKYLYADNASYSGGPPPDWFRRTGVQLVNTALAPCDPQADSCATAHATIGYAANETQITDPANRLWRIVDGASTFSITRPGSTSPNVTVTRDPVSGVVSQVTADGVTTNYALGPTPNTMTVTDALSETTTIISDPSVGRPTSVEDPLDRTARFAYDSYGRLTRVTAPLGNYVEYVYDEGTDVRGNVTRTIRSSGTNPASAEPIVTRATYAPTCANPVTCNLPISTIDARNHPTLYTYNQTHGGVETVTGPAVAVNGQSVQPQVRTTYTPTEGGVWLPTQVSACQTSASCANTADEVRSTTRYNANNLPDRVTTGDGAGVLTATTDMTYDAVGNLITVDGPLTDADDTVRYRYDAARRRTGIVSPDPDGTAGTLPNRAIRTTYRQDGQVERTETGIVNSQSDADWAQMIVFERSDVTFDLNNRPAVASRQGGGTIVSVVQTSYDALGRPTCVAQRMNPDQWNDLPVSACLPQEESAAYGPDRITRTVRDDGGQVTEQWSAFGTAHPARERLIEYTNNGQVEWVQDGEGNRTSYEYDGHDRLVRTFFPLAARGSNASNAADYEERTLDAAGNVTTFRNRAEQTINYTYDELNRMTFKDMPNAFLWDYDLSYEYDLLGRLVRARNFEPFWGPNGYYFSLAYDALGRLRSQTSHHGVMSWQYDLAGRRTRLTHNGGNYHVDYDHLVTGEVSRIRENAPWGTATIATYGYDIRGRRESLTRGNGTVASYEYDDSSRLTKISDLTNTAQAFTLEFRYNYAGQIVWSRRSNDLYSVAPAAGTVIENPNGLNQIRDRNGTTFVYDGNGNLLTDGTRTYLYAADNRLAQASGNWLGSDPLGRLNHSWYNNDGFDYEGHNLIVHRSGSTGPAYERYVHGPGADEPLMAVAADGSNRRFLHADERGSIVAVSDSSGNVVAVNRYDEYGAPASGNTGFFQYAGQPWLAGYGAQVYYSRARMYDPRLGRFLQTDPIGYGDGMNMYAYVGGDPVNNVDPSGRCGTQFGLWKTTRKSDENFATDFVGFEFDSTGCENVFGGGGLGTTTSYFSAGDGGVGGAGDSSPPPAPPRICRGPAHILVGNRRLINNGRNGGFLAPVRDNSAAIIPRQWGARGATTDERLRSIGPHIAGWTADGQSFFGLWDVIDHNDLAPNALMAQNIIMDRYPGRLILELNLHARDMDTMVDILVPGSDPCPEHTSDQPARP